MSQITNEFAVSALRNGIVVRSNRNYETKPAIVGAAVLEMANLGFKVTPDALSGMSTPALTEMIANARKVIGADRNMRPIYPGFPKQVQNLDTITLLVEQLLHYWSFGALLPDYPDVVRDGLPLEDIAQFDRTLEVLPAGKAAMRLIADLTTKGVALSDDDRALLQGSVDLAHPTMADLDGVLSKAKNRENVQTLLLALVKAGAETPDAILIASLPYTRTLDGVLRNVLAVAAEKEENSKRDFERAVLALADREAGAVRLRTLSRPARRALVARMGELSKGFFADALVTRSNLWRKVMRMVHPFKLGNLSEQAEVKRALDIIHSNVEYHTLNSFVEDAIAKGDVSKATALLAQNNPGALLRRLAEFLRASSDQAEAMRKFGAQGRGESILSLDAKALADAVREVGPKAAVSTLISSYNALLSINDNHARVNRVSGLNNTMLERTFEPVDEAEVKKVSDALLDALREALKKAPAPQGPVAVKSDQRMPLVRRDASTTDQTLERGASFELEGKGNVLRFFSYWKNTTEDSGYFDQGVVILDEDMDTLASLSWDSWDRYRDWGTYSGDKLVSPGDDAVEFYDIDLTKLRKSLPKARYMAMSLQSYSGIPMNDVDIITGVMLRSEPNSGEPFDARTVVTAASPTTESFQAIPLVFDLKEEKMTWIDSSSGSTRTGMSATGDGSIGSIVYDEMIREALTMGEVATLWAQAHEAGTVNEPVDEQAVLSLLG